MAGVGGSGGECGACVQIEGIEDFKKDEASGVYFRR